LVKSYIAKFIKNIQKDLWYSFLFSTFARWKHY
jgi:hypothetical protein